MIRPQIYIGVLDWDFISEIKGVDDARLKALIKPQSITINEDRKGVTCTIVTKHDKYDIEQEDKILISARYANIDLSQTNLPVMIVTNVMLKDDGVFEISAIDEFQYYTQTTNFVPNDIEITTEQSKFLKENFGVPNASQKNKVKEKLTTINSETDKTKKKTAQTELQTYYDSVGLVVNPNLKISELLGYLQSIIAPKMYYYGPGAYSVKLQENGVFKINDIDGDQTTGAWANASAFTKVSEIIDKMLAHYFTNIFMTSSSVNEGDVDRFRVRIISLNNAIPKTASTYQFNYIYGINLVSDDLVYKSATTQKIAVKGTFLNEAENEAKTNNPSKGTIISAGEQILIAYYDKSGELKIWDSVADKGKTILQSDLAYNELSVNAARVLSLEQRKKLVREKLESISYTGYEGSFRSFNYNTNILDRVVIQQRYNPISVNPLALEYGINKIVRQYDSSGLLTTYAIRQQLTTV